jgi:hypothetical protein
VDQDLGEFIASVEREFPDLRWLLRSCDEGEDMERIGGAYFAHIHSPDISWPGIERGEVVSYLGAGSSPAAALSDALHKARMATAA